MSYCFIATLPRWRVIVLFFPEFVTRYVSFGKRLLGPIQQARMCLSCRSQMYVLYRKLEDFALILYRLVSLSLRWQFFSCPTSLPGTALGAYAQLFSSLILLLRARTKVIDHSGLSMDNMLSLDKKQAV